MINLIKWHFSHPWTLPANPDPRLHLKDLPAAYKIYSVALAILASPLLLIGGVAAFYGATGYFKHRFVKEIKSKPSLKPINDLATLSLEQSRKITPDEQGTFIDQYAKKTHKPSQLTKALKPPPGTLPSTPTEAEAAAAPQEAASTSVARTASTLGLKSLPKNLHGAFSDVNSSNLTPSNYVAREDFLSDGKYKTHPPILSKSDFVSNKMAEHLMRRKKELACGIKYEGGDAITNMEGALHTFLTPVAKIKMTADYRYSGGHHYASFGTPSKSRDVVLSAAIHPDFELGGPDEVVMRLIELKPEAVEGKTLPEDFEPLANRLHHNSAQFKETREGYDKALLSHMVYHLTAAGRLPALGEVEGSVLTPEQALQELERFIKDKTSTQDIASQLAGKFVSLNSHVISLEALYNTYLNQVRNEISVLEAVLPQGYVYTIDPPSIFAKQIGIGNVPILNRLQMLAFKELKPGMQNLKIVGFNDYSDKGAIGLYQLVFPDKTIMPKAELFSGPGGIYSGPALYALVEHNNSDGFGQNIENESTTSKDGVLGVFSDASHCLSRGRPDLMQFIV